MSDNFEDTFEGMLDSQGGIIRNLKKRVANLEHNQELNAAGLNRLAKLASESKSGIPGQMVVDWAADEIERLQVERNELLELLRYQSPSVAAEWEAKHE